ncbi:sugar phosphate permease [Saccharopolyspora erythraea NRRL 2338]|uniref:General substrate transporter n=2 Tax=Saccharopolyspora erythraea TaxID=1836 RepID=A4FLJ1_SACEN|nr:MFS transporter [Saccharopolyspora erythraea]EQD85277.1 MFS transporter [Saccharopolyspora erythraea D]PFG98556.1 sugar phosphate permease [Saccharopolyspora erythraea NRRL 2338]QRK88597.1 MFS transporter [Saccharopolyspora erythraea]CAM04916.1 general substrate transporter [Saccharopolyspora erythraea NRRL 2338]
MTAPAPTGPAELGRQRWFRLLPVAFVTYSLAYLDRSNFSIGVAGGMKEELVLTGAMSSLIGASFFLGYCLFQIPGTLYAERRSVRGLIFWCTLAWGLLAAVQGLLHSAVLLIVVRFLLGAVEAAVLPAMVVFLARWFTRGERGSANAILILGNPITVMWLNAVSGYLVELTSWREMFIIEGLPAVVWAFVFRALVSDHPAEAKWLDEGEKRRVISALDAERAQATPASTFAAAFRSRPVVLLSAQYLLWSVGVYGLVFWLPSIVAAGTGQGIGMSGLLAAIPFGVAALLMVLNSRLSDRAGSRPRFVWPWLLFGGVGFYLSYLLGPDNFWPAFALLVLAGGAMYAPYGPYFAHVAEILPKNFAGAGIACVNTAGSVGGFFGTYLVGWLNDATGGTAASFVMMAATMVASALITPLVRGQRPAEVAATT